MNQKHVTSLDLSKQLAEAGIVIESEYVWCHGDLIPVINIILETAGSEIYPAPIATEILERLPENVTIISHINDSRLIGGNMAVHGDVRVLNNSLPDALALLLIRLTKDGLI